MTSSGVFEQHDARSEAERLFRLQKAALAGGVPPDLALRRDRLRRLQRLLTRHGDAFAAAIEKDFGSRPAEITGLAEIVPSLTAIRHARRHIRRWMRPRAARVALSSRPARARIMPQPLGVVGIIAPWNYPLQLLVCPLVGVLAAGNRAILKPSEFTPHFSALFQSSIAALFAEDEVAVLTGGADVARALTELPLDHLIFTGSTAVGRLVAQAAAKNLTPVTLELGGKSPAIIDRTADLDTTAERLAWGKCVNAGQTCIAPDYALVPRTMVDPFLLALRTAVARQYPTVAGNRDYTSIINDRHYHRLEKLVDEARAGGATVLPLTAPGDVPKRLFAPVALLDVPLEAAVMREEIFGPILPVIAYDTLDEAIGFVNARERPLALYWFGTDPAARDRVLTRTISGGVCVNDTLAHVLQEDLPFGGVGASGQGHYHGEHGFRRLSKEKAVFFQTRFSGVKLAYPPFTSLTRRLVAALRRFA